MSLLSKASLPAALLVSGLVTTVGPGLQDAVPEGPPQTGLQRALALDEGGDEEGEERVSRWRTRLLDADLDRREQHYDRLIDAVRRNPELRDLLTDWASEAGEPELAWTSRLALRELAQQPAWGFSGVPNARGFGPSNPWFAEALERMRSVAPDLPELEGLLDGPGGPSTSARSETFHFSMNPDGGVRVQVSRDVAGERAVETYEADSMSALLERHPLLAERLHLSHRAGLPWTRASAVRLDAPDPWSADETNPLVRTDVLGVIAVPLEPSAGGFPGHPENAGVRVKKVVEQTIAARLGVRAGDVLLEVNGLALEHDDDISTAMRQRREGDEVNVVLVDRFGRERSRTWTPAP